MASSGLKGKRLVDIFGRQSFDRFGDDLSENILSYLTIEDKYRLRCVSKQWSHLIPNTQTVLEFSFESKNKDNFRRLSLQFPLIVSTRLVAVLKTFTAIKTIRFGDNVFIDDPVLDAISQWCPRLESIDIRFDNLSDVAITRFGQRFGQNLKSVIITDKYQQNVRKTEILLGICPNIDSLQYYGSHTTFARIRPLIRLKTLIVDSGQSSGSQLGCGLFLASLFRLSPNLRVLRLSGPDYLGSDVNDQAICQLIAGCLRLKSIELDFRSHITYRTIDKLIETANKRPKESIAFKAFVEWSVMLKSPRLDRKHRPKNLSIDINI